LVEFVGDMAQERLQEEDEKSLWKSRLFKAGLAFVAAGLLVNSAAALTVGFAAMGGAWATAK